MLYELAMSRVPDVKKWKCRLQVVVNSEERRKVGAPQRNKLQRGEYFKSAQTL